MNKITMPLGIQIIIGAFISILLGTIILAITVVFELITLQNFNESLSDSILDGAITLFIGLGLYYFIRNVIGKVSAEFTLLVFPVIHSKIEEALKDYLITEEEAFDKKKSLLEYTQTIHTLDGLHVIIRWSFLLIILIFIALSSIAYSKPIDIDVGKFAIFETVVIIGLYFSILIYMYTVDEKAYKLI